MELTRRQFIISSSAVASAIAMPSILISANEKVNYKFNEFKDFKNEQVQSLDKYVLSSMISSLLSGLILAYTLELFDLVATFLIIIISITILL